MYRRIAAAVAAAAAAVLLVATPAWADLLEPEGLPSLPPGLVTVEPVGEPPACVGEPFEIAPGEWDCVIVDAPPADPDFATGTIGDGYDGPEPTPEPDPVWTGDAVEVVEPEPVDTVEGDGDWGWSDAREMYAL